MRGVLYECFLYLYYMAFNKNAFATNSNVLFMYASTGMPVSELSGSLVCCLVFNDGGSNKAASQLEEYGH